MENVNRTEQAEETVVLTNLGFIYPESGIYKVGKGEYEYFSGSEFGYDEENDEIVRYKAIADLGVFIRGI